MEQKICNDELYEEVANELKGKYSFLQDISSDTVREIVNTQSLFTVKTIKKGAFESVRYVYLGKIAARLRKVQKINEQRGKQTIKE